MPTRCSPDRIAHRICSPRARKSLITRRDIAVALITLSGTLGVGAAVTAAPILGPTVFDWNKMVPVKTAVGEVRSLYRGPTATLDELEMHVGTLNPGETSH